MALLAHAQRKGAHVIALGHTADDRAESMAAAARQDAINNRWYIEAITKGTYPSEAMEGLADHMPANWQDDMPQISQPIDFLGVNYYTRSRVTTDEGAAWPAIKAVANELPETQMGWEIYPEGLRSTLNRMARDYVGDMPMFVTATGIAWDDTVDNGAIYDPERVAFMSSHLGAIRDAIGDGANVQGFFYWSLMDNYEWAFGYEKRFGMVHVDFDTLERTPKASYQALKSMASGTGTLT